MRLESNSPAASPTATETDQSSLHFHDISKKGTRRWCSMQLCGNRLKVAACAARRCLHARKRQNIKFKTDVHEEREATPENRRVSGVSFSGSKRHTTGSAVEHMRIELIRKYLPMCITPLGCSGRALIRYSSIGQVRHVS